MRDNITRVEMLEQCDNIGERLMKGQSIDIGRFD